MNGHKPKATVLDRPRARRDAAKVLAVALQARHRKLLLASGEEEIVRATADLAQCMYENLEFVIWCLKTQGGMNPPPPDELRKVTASQPVNDPRFTKPPALELQDDEPLDLPCTCPPLEAGIIGRNRHMASCPKFVPTFDDDTPDFD